MQYRYYCLLLPLLTRCVALAHSLGAACLLVMPALRVQLLTWLTLQLELMPRAALLVGQSPGETPLPFLS